MNYYQNLAGTKDDPAVWFNDLGQCDKCGQPAHGWLMNTRNERMGRYCTRCAKSRLKKAEKAKEKAGRV